MVRTTRATLAAALLLVLGASLVACGDGADTPKGTGASTSPTPAPSESPTELGDTTPDGTTPTAAAPLDWQPTGHTAEERVVAGASWTAVATETTVTFEPAGDGKEVVVPGVESRTDDAVLL